MEMIQKIDQTIPNFILIRIPFLLYKYFYFFSDALQATVSALYCKMLVILGLAFPMSEVMSAKVPRGFYQLFYVYLFLGSLLFLIYIYIDLVRTKTKVAVHKRRNWISKIVKKNQV